jgi:hypothetical protein
MLYLKIAVHSMMNSYTASEPHSIQHLLTPSQPQTLLKDVAVRQEKCVRQG